MISSVIFTNVDSHKLGGENLIKMAYFDSLGGHSPENLSIVRRIVLNILKHDKTRKIGLARKRRMAGLNIDYMEKLLCQYD